LLRLVDQVDMVVQKGMGQEVQVGTEFMQGHIIDHILVQDTIMVVGLESM
jgi:hypothetical protein